MHQALREDLFNQSVPLRQPGIIAAVFMIDNTYSRADIHDLLGVQADIRKGDWLTGYTKFQDSFYVFVTVGMPGRTGQDYPNRWRGDQLVWYGKSQTTFNQPQILELLSGKHPVHVFYRTHDRGRFTYAGLGHPRPVDGTAQPVSIIWTFQDMWSDYDYNVLIERYYSLLECQLRGSSYSIDTGIQELSEFLRHPTVAVRRRFGNVSTLLNYLGLIYLHDIKPQLNFSAQLVDAMDQWLDRFGEHSEVNPSPGLQQDAPLIEVEPPDKTTEFSTPELLLMAKRFDPAKRDAHNTELGFQGESFAIASERSRLIIAGRHDLATRVKWVSRDCGDGAGYDIRSFSCEGEERFLEVKTTGGHLLTPFYITENERHASEAYGARYRIYRIFDVYREPTVFQLPPPLAERLHLHPRTYLATFE